MTQAEVLTKLREISDPITALDLSNELKGKKLPSLYRNLRDLIKNKQVSCIKAGGRNYYELS